MKPVLLSTLALLAACACAAADSLDLTRIDPAPPNEPVPVMDFFRPRLLQNPQVNDSGSHLAAIITTGNDKHELMIYDLEKKTMQILASVGDKDVYSFTWLTDKRLVYSLASEKIYGMGLIAVDIDRPRNLRAVLQYWPASMVGIPERNKNRPLMWIRDSNQDRLAEVDTSLDTGGPVNLNRAGTTWSEADTVYKNNELHVVKSYPVPQGGIGSGFMTDRDGEVAYGFTGKDGFFTAHRFLNNAWEKCPVDLDQIDIVGAGNEPDQLVVLEPRGSGKPRALRFMKASTGELGDVLVQDAAYDFRGWLYRDRVSHEIVGAMYDRDGAHTVWFSDGYRELQKAVSAMFKGRIVRIVDGDKSGRFIIATWSDRQPVVYHWVDLAKKSVGLIKKSAPWIDPERMRPMNVLKYKTRDGHQMDAYVTLPAGASKKNPAPLIVLPHGGPWARDSWGFNGEVQFYASRGYAVLQPNYRGSPGYGWMFSIEDEWAFRKMHDDVTDATKTLLATGLVDRTRVAIAGSSFGAYLALSGVVHEPELYRCAVTIAGVFDWEKVMRDEKFDQYSSASYAYLKRRLGDPKLQKEKFDEISPVRHVDQVKVPVFVSHGKEDWIADVGESRRLIAELEKYRIPHEVLLVGGEGHGMSHLKNQVELYSRVEAFLKKNLAPTASAAPAPAPGT